MTAETLFPSRDCTTRTASMASTGMVNWRWARSFLPHRVEGADLDRGPAGDSRLASPRQPRVEIGDVQHPETADMLLRLDIRPVGDEHHAVGLGPDRLGAAGRLEAADEGPDARRDHLAVERRDVAAHRVVL